MESSAISGTSFLLPNCCSGFVFLAPADQFITLCICTVILRMYLFISYTQHVYAFRIEASRKQCTSFEFGAIITVADLAKFPGHSTLERDTL